MSSIPSAKEALERIASELERGNRDPAFFDPRGGFIAVVSWHNGALSNGYWPESRERIQSVLNECSEFLAAAQGSGWNAVTSKAAEALAAKIRAAE